MNNKTLYSLYLFPTLLHIFLVTVIAGVLKKVGFELGYHSTLGNVLIILGGISSALWGVIYQKKFPYVVATIMTFICWGVWHFLFFYIDGSLTAVDIPFFFLGLLTNSFILSALFAYSNSLWICAMTHALINAFSQISVNGNEMTSMILRLACIDLAIMLFYLSRKKRQ